MAGEPVIEGCDWLTEGGVLCPCEPCDCRPVGVTVKFNPFAFTIEQNNEFLAKGYEPIIAVDPRMDREDLG